MNLSLILLAAGESNRLNIPCKKQWIRIGKKPLWEFVAEDFYKLHKFNQILIVVSKDDFNYINSFYSNNKFKFIVGGEKRQDSISNALEFVSSDFVMISDVARALVDDKVVKDLISNIKNFDCISPFLDVCDTTYCGNEIMPRNEIKLIQTPQISNTKLLKKALNLAKEKNIEFTDDSMAIKYVGGSLGFIKGSEKSKKITFLKDLKTINLIPPDNINFIGNGFDVHSFESGDYIKLCATKIECGMKFKAHSDGDVGLHALIDAILGACGLGDIGEHFPDSDNTYKGINSEILLANIVKRVKAFGFDIVNVDITIIAQTPKIGNYKIEMKKNIAQILNIDSRYVNIKATTTEYLGFIGRKEGIAVIATANLKYFDWKNYESIDY